MRADGQVHITHLITGLETGGTELQLYKLLSHLDRTRFQNHVVSMTSHGPVGNRIKSLGITVDVLGMRPGVTSLAAALELWTLLRRYGCDVLQTWLYHADLLGVLVGKLAGLRAVWNLRCSDVELWRTKHLSSWILTVLCRLSRWPEVVVVNSAAGQRYHEQLGYHPKRWHVISNGVDLDEYRPDESARDWLRGSLGLLHNDLLIGLVARFDAMKDHKSFLEAAAKLSAINPHIHFILCGENVDLNNSALLGLLRRYDLGASTHLLGLRDDVPRITAGLDIACSASSSEGFCNAISEAMACGVVCAVTDVGDSARIVGDTGRVVPARDPDALAKALAELIGIGREGRNILGLVARARIEEHFDIRRVIMEYEELYTSLMRMETTVA